MSEQDYLYLQNNPLARTAIAKHIRFKENRIYCTVQLYFVKSLWVASAVSQQHMV